jgi:hypothetical protein
LQNLVKSNSSKENLTSNLNSQPQMQVFSFQNLRSNNSKDQLNTLLNGPKLADNLNNGRNPHGQLPQSMTTSQSVDRFRMSQINDSSGQHQHRLEMLD